MYKFLRASHTGSYWQSQIWTLKKKKNIYFWLCWVFTALRGLSLVAASRGYSSLQCLLLSRSMALGAWTSVVGTCGLSNCGTWAQLPHGTWNLSGPGIEPMSPALAGRFLSTVPPGKSWIFSLSPRQKVYFIVVLFCLNCTILPPKQIVQNLLSLTSACKILMSSALN